jgi:hypothetical protein
VQGLKYKNLDEGELKQIIARELDTALGAEGGTLSQDRETALKYYQGDAFGNEVDGRSQVVMRSVLETVEWVLPALLRIFTASDKIAEFEPTREDDEAAGEQATKYVSYIFYRDNSGFMLLHDWMKDALIQKLGWVKIYWDTQKVPEFNSYTGLTAEQYAALKKPGTEVIEEKSYPAPPQDGFNEDAPGVTSDAPMLYDCTLRVVREQGRVKLENVPPEEVLVSRRAKHGQALPFTCHRRERTYTDLVQEGYDKATLDLIPSLDAPEFNSERLTRFEDEQDLPATDERTDKAMRTIWVEESYLRADVDGDDVAELLKVVTAQGGAVILTKNDGKPDIEPIDEVPLVSICPIPMPHKLVGMSLADLVMDLQLIKSTLVRQMLDNVYLTNNPRHYVDEGKVTENTIDDLLTSRPGGLVRGKGENAVVPFVTPFVAEKTMQLVEYFDQTSEVRTGVSRHNQGLNPDDLNKTATGVNLIQQAAAQRVELIARIFAETGVKEVCRRILGLVTRYQQAERIIRLTGNFVPMDPRQWRNQMEVSVSVGLGTGNRDQTLAHLKELLAAQFQIVQVQQGVNGPLVYAKNVYDALDYATEQMGVKQSFFTDPSQPPPPGLAGPPQPPKPDPEMLKLQAQIAADQARQQASVEADRRKEQFDMERDRQKAQIDAANDQRDFEYRAQFAAQEFQLKRWEAQQRIALEERKLQMRAELEAREMQIKADAGAYAPRPAPSQQGAGA